MASPADEYAVPTDCYHQHMMCYKSCVLMSLSQYCVLYCSVITLLANVCLCVSLCLQIRAPYSKLLTSTIVITLHTHGNTLEGSEQHSTEQREFLTTEEFFNTTNILIGYSHNIEPVTSLVLLHY